MNRNTTTVRGKWQDNDDDETTLAYGTRRKERPQQPVARRPIKKQSFEDNTDVQRWLMENAFGESRKAPFRPEFLEGRRDAEWLLSSFIHFYEQDLITDIVQEVKSGKEATVFTCTADPSTGEDMMAAKVYRPRMFRSLSNDAIYRKGRTIRDESGKVQGSRVRIPGANTAKGRAFQVSSWIDFEYETHQMVYAAGVKTPRPFAHMGNAILMGYLGDQENPAPRLNEVELLPGEAKDALDTLMNDIRLSLLAHRIHGDLSAYNVLVWNEQLWVIDFAQAVDPRQSEDAFMLLGRDVQRVVDALRPYGVRAHTQTLVEDLWQEYLASR